MSATPKLVKSAPRGRRAAKAAETSLPFGLAEADGDVDLDTRLQQIVDAAAAVPGIRGSVLLLSTSPGRLRAVAASGSLPVRVDDLLTMDGGSLSWGDGELRQSVALQGEPADAGTETADAIGLPVTLMGSELGSLVAFPAPADEASVPTLREIARLAAPAAALRRVAALETHVVEINSIVEVGQVLTGLLDMQDVLAYVVYLAESLVSGHAASVALISEDGEHLILHSSTGNLRDYEGQQIPIRESLIGWVVEHGEPVITPSVSDDPRSFALSTRQGPGVVVPITNSGRIIGAFVVARVEGASVFDPESATILQRMAAYAAIAITNAEIHRRQQEVADTLRSQATELERAYGELRRSQDQLLISEKMAALGRVTAGIAHEINSPLAGILNSLRTARGFVEEYRTSAGDPEITVEDHQGIADDILNALSVADSAVNKVAQFVKTIKGQTRVGDGQKSTFDPAAEVDATVSLLQHELRRRRVEVYTEMERGHLLSGDQGKFGLVIQNLVSNALDAFEGKPGEIWVRVAAEGGQLRLSVEDKGCGIPEEIRGRIFDYLFTTKDVSKGTGLGLAMVHSVVTSDFRGTITLDSEPGVGTTFTLTLPLTSADSDHGA